MQMQKLKNKGNKNFIIYKIIKQCHFLSKWFFFVSNVIIN